MGGLHCCRRSAFEIVLFLASSSSSSSLSSSSSSPSQLCVLPPWRRRFGLKLPPLWQPWQPRSPGSNIAAMDFERAARLMGFSQGDNDTDPPPPTPKRLPPWAHSHDGLNGEVGGEDNLQGGRSEVEDKGGGGGRGQQGRDEGGGKLLQAEGPSNATACSNLHTNVPTRAQTRKGFGWGDFV